MQVKLNDRKDYQNIIITAPKGYSSGLSKALQELPLTIKSCPAIETVILDATKQYDLLFSTPEEFNYIAFCSRKAIESFNQYLLLYPNNKELLGKWIFCSIGKDQECMKELLGTVKTLTPLEPSPHGIAQALNVPENAGKNIAVLAPQVEGIAEPSIVPTFIKELSQIPMHVTRINAYATRPVEERKINELISFIKTGGCYLVFTSGSEIEALSMQYNPKELPQKVKVVCFGPYTASIARQMNWKVDLIAQDYHSFQGIAEIIRKDLVTNIIDR